MYDELSLIPAFKEMYFASFDCYAAGIYISLSKTLFETFSIPLSCRSDQGKYSKTVACFWDIFNDAIMNDLSMTLTSRLKVDSKCVYQQ